MTIVLSLLDGGTGVSLSAGMLDGLARLGVTGVVVLSDDQTMAVVMEGWAFEGERINEAAAMVAAGHPVRILHPIARMMVAPMIGG